MMRNSIPTIKVSTASIEGEYKVSEATAHKIVRMLLEDIEKTTGELTKNLDNEVEE